MKLVGLCRRQWYVRKLERITDESNAVFTLKQ